MRAMESSSFSEPDILGRPPKEIRQRGARQKANPQNWGTRWGLSLWKPCYKNWDKRSERD